MEESARPSDVPQASNVPAVAGILISQTSHVLFLETNSSDNVELSAEKSLPIENNALHTVDASSILFEDDVNQFHMDELDTSADLYQSNLSHESTFNDQPLTDHSEIGECMDKIQDEDFTDVDDHVIEPTFQPIRSSSPEISHLERLDLLPKPPTDPDEHIRESTASTVNMLNSAAMATLRQPLFPDEADETELRPSSSDIHLDAVKARLFQDNRRGNDETTIVNEPPEIVHRAVPQSSKYEDHNLNKDSERNRPHRKPFRVPAPPPLRPYVPPPRPVEPEAQSNLNQRLTSKSSIERTGGSSVCLPTGWVHSLNTLRPLLGRATDHYLQLLQYSHSGWYRRPSYLTDYNIPSMRHNTFSGDGITNSPATYSTTYSPRRPTSTAYTFQSYDQNRSYLNESFGPSLKITPVKRLYTSQFWRERLESRDITSVINKLV